MKKFYTKGLLPALIVSVLLLAGCGKEPAASAAPTAQPTAAPTATPVASTPAPSEEPVPSPTATPEAPTPTPDPNLINVTEENYAQLVHELSQTPELYLEKSVRIQGMYLMEKPEGLGITTHFVYRLGPDCDDEDAGLLGLQIVPPEGFTAQDGDWIDVQGILRIVSVDGYPFLALDEAQVTIDNEHRGVENIEDIE